MCKAPKMPTPPPPLAPPQPATSPIGVPNRRRRSGQPGTAGYQSAGEGSILGQTSYRAPPVSTQPTGGFAGAARAIMKSVGR